MSKVYLTSDWHIGHKSILKYRTNVSTIEEHDNLLINNYKSIVKKNDTVYFLGDMCFDKAGLKLIDDLPGNKILVLGNHDSEYIDTVDFLLVFNKVIGLKSYKGFWLSHAPIHHDELRGKYNIHGHTHAKNISDYRYFNVSPENTNYMPISFKDIENQMK